MLVADWWGDGVSTVCTTNYNKNCNILIYLFYEYRAAFNGFITECFYNVRAIKGEKTWVGYPIGLVQHDTLDLNDHIWLSTCLIYQRLKWQSLTETAKGTPVRPIRTGRSSELPSQYKSSANPQLSWVDTIQGQFSTAFCLCGLSYICTVQYICYANCTVSKPVNITGIATRHQQPPQITL